MAWRGALAAVGVAAALGAGVGWTQARPPEQADPAPSGPVPTEFPLTRTGLDQRAFGEAQRDPLAARLRGVLSQDRATAPLLSRFDASLTPVLGPADPSLLRTARYYPGDAHYTLVVRKEGLVVEIFGSSRALQSPAGAALPAPAAPASAPRAFVRAVDPAAAATATAARRGLSQIRAEQTEYGVDVSFVRFGAAYNLTFICDAMGPPDCTEAAAVNFAASLQLLGGGGQ